MCDTKCFFCEQLEDFEKRMTELEIVYESDKVLAFYATKPFAEVHIIVISKKHIATIFDLTEKDDALKLDMFTAIKNASEIIIKEKGACKTEMYLGELQWTKHLHCHVTFDPSID